MKNLKPLWLLPIAIAALVLYSLFSRTESRQTVHAGFFPNITHAQALIGRADGTFEKKIGTKVEWTVFNAGPSVIEALFAGHLDLAYVGPSPAVNGYVKSQGEALAVIAGSASGGTALVVRSDSGIRMPKDFAGRKIASPQLGNTQDVALRSWLLQNGLTLKESGGNVQVMPIANADQVTLFLKKEIDGAWTVEPWVATLVSTAQGKIFLDESTLWPDGTYATALVIASKKFLKEKPDLAERFLQAHVEITDWINAHPGEAKMKIGQEIERLTQKPLPAAILDSAFGRIRFTTDAMVESVKTQAEAAFRAGYLKNRPNLSGLFDLRFLSQAQKARSLESKG